MAIMRKDKPTRTADRHRLDVVQANLPPEMRVSQYGHPARRMGVAHYPADWPSRLARTALREAGVAGPLDSVSGPAYAFRIDHGAPSIVIV